MMQKFDDVVIFFTLSQRKHGFTLAKSKIEHFATAVRAREVRPDVVVPHSKVSQKL